MLGERLEVLHVLLRLLAEYAGHQKPQGINRKVRFAAFASPGAIIIGAFTTFRTGLQCSAVKSGGAGLFFPACCQPQQGAQVVDHRFKHTCLQPALGLLVDPIPGWQIVGHHAPGYATPHDIAQAIEDFAQGMIALWRFFRHQCQVGGDKCPFFVTYVTVVGFSGHTPYYSNLTLKSA